MIPPSYPNKANRILTEYQQSTSSSGAPAGSASGGLGEISVCILLVFGWYAVGTFFVLCWYSVGFCWYLGGVRGGGSGAGW